MPNVVSPPACVLHCFRMPGPSCAMLCAGNCYIDPENEEGYFLTYSCPYESVLMEFKCTAPYNNGEEFIICDGFRNGSRNNVKVSIRCHQPFLM